MLGVVDQTLFSWVKAQRAGKLTGVDSSRKQQSPIVGALLRLLQPVRVLACSMANSQSKTP